MKKSNIYEGLIIAAIIIFVSGWYLNEKSKIFNSMKTIVEENNKTISEEFQKETGKITEEIRKEKYSRAELAGVLLKSGIDIPTKFLISFSSADSDKEARKIFLSSFTSNQDSAQNSATWPEKLTNIIDNNKESTAYISSIDDDNSIVVFAKVVIDANTGLPVDTGSSKSVKITSNDFTKLGSFSFTANTAPDFIKLLENKHITTGNIVIIPTTAIIIESDETSTIN